MIIIYINLFYFFPPTPLFFNFYLIYYFFSFPLPAATGAVDRQADFQSDHPAQQVIPSGMQPHGQAQGLHKRGGAMCQWGVGGDP